MIDLAEMLIPWEKCFKVHVGAIDLRAIQLMDEKKYDFAPVFDHQPKSTLIRQAACVDPWEWLAKLSDLSG